MPTDNRQKMLTVVAVAAIALFAGDKLILSPLMGVWSRRADRITQLRKQLGDGRRLMERGPALRRRWEEWRSETLPNNTSAAEQQVFSALDYWALDSRVALTSVTPQWKHDSDDYMTYECRLEAFGTLQTLTRFMYDVESDPMALKLDSIELGSRDKDGQQITLGLSISGLVLTPQAK
jgi:hypothetical protein